MLKKVKIFTVKSVITHIDHYHLDPPLQNKSDTESDYGSDGSVYNVGKYSSRSFETKVFAKE